MSRFAERSRNPGEAGSAPSYTVVIDHNDPKHDEQMARAARELSAWAKRQGCTQVVREERELRPGVMQLKFLPGARRAEVRRDQLVLSHRH